MAPLAERDAGAGAAAAMRAAAWCRSPPRSWPRRRCPSTSKASAMWRRSRQSRSVRKSRDRCSRSISTEGQDVEKGQLLFTIDPRPFELAVKQAEAQLAKDTGQSKTAGNPARTVHEPAQERSGRAVRFRHRRGASQLAAVDAERLIRSRSRTPSCSCSTRRSRRQSPGEPARCRFTSARRCVRATPRRWWCSTRSRRCCVTFAMPAVSLPDIRAGQARGRLTVEAIASGRCRHRSPPGAR